MKRNASAKNTGLSAPPPSFGLLDKTRVAWRRLFTIRKRNILLVGTSNCMLKRGISLGLASQPGVGRLENRSLGASSSIHLARSTEDIDFSKFDFCILEFSVNEDVLLRSHAARPELIEINLRHIVARCVHAGCIPVILIFPRKPDPEKNAGRTFYLEFARRFNLPFFDGYSLIAALKKKHRLEHDGLFQNPNHVMPDVGYLFAKALAPGLLRITRLRARLVPSAWQWRELAQLQLSPAQAPGCEIVTRRNTRFTESFCVLTPEAPLVIDLGATAIGELTGVAVNIGNTQGFLIIEGETRAILDLRNEYCGQQRHALSISILPLADSIKPRAGKVTVRCTLDESETVGCAGKMSEFLGNSTRTEGPARIEISRLIGVSGTDRQGTCLPAPELHFDLANPALHASLLNDFARHTPLPKRPKLKKT